MMPAIAIRNLVPTVETPTAQPAVAAPPAAQTATPSAEDSGEHRVAKRHRVLKAAKIVMDDWRAIDCQVRDISETGAKIRVEGAATLPHKFKLLMVQDNMIRDVQVAWFLSDCVGVAFLGPASKAPVRKFVTGMC